MAFSLTEKESLSPAWASLAVSICVSVWMFLIGGEVAKAHGNWGATVAWSALCAVLLAAPYLLIAALVIVGKRAIAMIVGIGFVLSFWLVDWGFVRFLPVEMFGIMNTASGTLIADAFVKAFKGLEFFAASSTLICMVFGQLAIKKGRKMRLVFSGAAALWTIAWLLFFWGVHSSYEAGASAMAALVSLASYQFLRHSMA